MQKFTFKDDEISALKNEDEANLENIKFWIMKVSSKRKGLISVKTLLKRSKMALILSEKKNVVQP